jgi:polysaccharide pyruvyl transferase WcaK-like protein
LLFSKKNKDFIYHIGLFGRNFNVGDVILYSRLEKTFDIFSKNTNKWFHRLAFGEITSIEIYLINKYCKLMLVGGHGLIMPSSNKNNNSGWGFNIKSNNLRKLKIPLVFFAIGYNVFNGEDYFIPVFRKHIKLCVEKSVFFGLRNYGSINSVKKYLPDYLHEKVKYQPCPTTIIELGINQVIAIKTDNNEIGISVAFNNFEKRFGSNYLETFEQLIAYCEFMKKKGYKITFFGHHVLDKHSKYAKYFENFGYPILPLYKYSENDVYKFYKGKKLIIGMRGHSLMIPFGLTVPLISLETQQKQKWFIETTNHNEWNIKITNNIYEKLSEITMAILENYDYVKNEIKRLQEINEKITKENINYILNIYRE